MEIGVGIDQRLGLSVAQLRDLAPLARDLGYDSIWTNASPEYDPVVLCTSWHAVSALATGVSVVPIARNPAAVLALAARSLHEVSGGRFTLGIGSGSVTERPVAAVREYAELVRKSAPDVPLAIGALGPRMLALAGTHAAAAALNWCTPAQIAWSRTQAGPSTKLVMYIRVCIDDDVRLARRALAEQILSYALMVRPSGARGYRAHFERMGFADELAMLERAQAGGSTPDALAAAVPDRMIDAFGYAGDGTGARERFAELAQGLDIAIVRVLSARPGDQTAVRRAIEALAPGAARA